MMKSRKQSDNEGKQMPTEACCFHVCCFSQDDAYGNNYAGASPRRTGQARALGDVLNSAKLDLASETHGNKTAMFRDEIEYLHGSLLSRNSKSKYFFSKN